VRKIRHHVRVRSTAAGSGAAAGRSRTDVDQLYARARALLGDYRQAEAERLLRQILARIDTHPSASGLTRDRVLLTLANVRAERGQLSQGLAMLDDLDSGASEALSGLVASQRGLMLLRAGRLNEALSHMDEAERRLGDQPQELARVLLNRGFLRLGRGEMAHARTDFLRCLQVATTGESAELIVKSRFNLGYLAYLAGDLPRALAQMDEALRQADEAALGTQAVGLLDRARVLHAAGLAAEADADLRRAVAHFAAEGSRQDQAECELARAAIAVSEGRPQQAQELARAAERRFLSRGATTWALQASLVRLQARLEAGQAGVNTARAAQELHARLSAGGLVDDARVALATATRAWLAARRPDHAEETARELGRVRPGDKLLTRLQVRGALAAVAGAQGRRRAELANLARGLRELQRQQASFGCLDLQTGVMRHGQSLAARGLCVALEDGRPALVFEWAERARAVASRLDPVRPPHDEEAAGLLGQLRHLRIELRAAELAGQPGSGLRARCAELERAIRERSWYMAGGQGHAEPVRLAEVRRALADTGSGDAVLLVHLACAGQLHLLVADARGARLVPLGPVDEVHETLRRLRADLDTLALAGLPGPIRDSVHRSLRRDLDLLARSLCPPHALAASDGPVVLVPSGALVGVPWPALAGLRGRPVSVTRSATTWFARRPPSPVAPSPSTGTPAVAGQGWVPGPRRSPVPPDGTPAHASEGNATRGGAPLPFGALPFGAVVPGASPSGTVPPGSVLLVAGPDLAHATTELARIAPLYPGAEILADSGARVEDVLRAVGRARMVHVAAHGTHEVASPLFSALRLADGPLFGYDLDRATRMPELVVLSSCDLGLAAVRPGEELLGMTAALLHAGVGCVVAAVARVSDEVAANVAGEFHAALVRGAVPSAALASAIGARPDAPFVVYGRGF